MVDYTSQKVAELQELLKERGLSHTGKKAELIARLQASDAEQSTSTPTPSTTAPEKPASAAPASVTAKASASSVLAAAGGKGQPANPAAVPNQKRGEEPAADTGLSVSGGGDPAKRAATAQTQESSATATATDPDPAGPKQDFSAHIPTLTLEEEIEKRRKRAERFGPVVKSAAPAINSSDTKAAENGESSKNETERDPLAEAQRLLERQKRFGGVSAGGEVSALESLNAALPERARKRGRAEKDGDGNGERDGKRRDSRRRDAKGTQAQNKGDGKVAGGKGAAAATQLPVRKVGSEQAEKDRIAAEKRKARFGPKTSA